MHSVHGHSRAIFPGLLKRLKPILQGVQRSTFTVHRLAAEGEASRFAPSILIRFAYYVIERPFAPAFLELQPDCDAKR
jgi:hypothetical protein